MNGQPGDHPGWVNAESHSEGNTTGSFMIRKGPWKYLHFTWYDDLLFNLDEDPGEFSRPQPATRPRKPCCKSCARSSTPRRTPRR